MSKLKTHGIRPGTPTATLCGRYVSECQTGDDVDCKACLSRMEHTETAPSTPLRAPEPFDNEPLTTATTYADLDVDWYDDPAEDMTGYYIESPIPVDVVVDKRDRRLLCDGCGEMRIVSSPDGRGLLCRRCSQLFRVMCRKRKVNSTGEGGHAPHYKKPRRPRGTGVSRKYRRQYTKNRHRA